MKFVFPDKCEIETDIITSILTDEKIPYKIKRNVSENHIENDEEEFVIVEELFDIICYTDLDHFDYVKYIACQKLINIIKLERCLSKKNRNVSKTKKTVASVRKKQKE